MSDQVVKAKEFKSCLAQARHDQGISQSKLALELEISQSHLSGLENGKYNPSLVTFMKWAHALGYEVELQVPKSE